MATRYDVGTPLGGERKSRRMHSPLSEMDDIVGTLDFEDHVDAPNTPQAAYETAASASSNSDLINQISTLLDTKFDAKLSPVVESIASMQKEIADLNGQVNQNHEKMEVKVANMENDFENFRVSTVAGKESTNAQIKTLELQIGKLEEVIGELFKKGTVTAPDSSTESEVADRERTAVLGGLSCLSGEAEAYQWLEDKLWDLYGPTPTHKYIKGDFKGIIFAKFHSKEDRDTAVALIRSMIRTHEDPEVWAKPDMLLAPRTLRSTVFGIKYAMVEWGWPKESLWADKDAGTVKLAGETVLTVSVEGNELKTEYATGWAEYFDDRRHPEVKEILKAARDKMTKASGKGSGKDKGSKGTTLGY